jgi:Undecaprenyl-phosphate glucose phosphotransferase
MLKAHEKTFSLLQKAADVFVASACWLITIYVRFYYFKGEALAPYYIKLSLPLAFLTYYFFSRGNLYKSQRLSKLRTEIWSLVKANFFIVVTFLVLIYFVNQAKLSRAAVLGYFCFSTTMFCLSRIFLRWGLRYFRRQGKNLRHVVLVGYGDIIDAYVKNLKNFPDAGIHLSAWIDSQGLAEKYQIPAYNDPAQARKIFKPDYYVISYPGAANTALDEFLRKNFNDVVPIIVLPDFRYSFFGYQVEDLAGFPALIVNQPDFSSIDIVTKRIFDIVVSGLGLLVLSPLLLLVGLIIKLDSKGPVFFRQKRVGLDGLQFKMWKFRSMRVSAESESQWTIKDDPRRTKFGKFLRYSSIDELPQLLNVFMGEMSLVGPRPEQPQFVEKFRHEIPAYMLRQKMKAGITGWAQVNGWRGDTSLEKRIDCDLYYVRNWSIWLDIQILFLTVWRGFLNKNAY